MSRRDCITKLRSASPTILPSLLLCDFGNLEREIRLLEEAGVDGFHLDVMDGVFVPNFTYGMTIVRAVRGLTELPLDVHLMMVDPAKYVSRFYDAGADIITIHAEAVEEPRPVLDSIRALGGASGIAINPATAVSKIENLISHADIALVMSVNAGFGGQSFDPSVLGKLQEIRGVVGGSDVVLEIDGGINVETIASAAEHGSQLLVVGSAIFRAPDYHQAINRLNSQLDKINEHI
jgi:ribulose-phosphate 3-epimerase